MKNRIITFLLTSCLCLTLLIPCVSASDTTAKTIAQSYKTILNSAQLYKYASQNAVAFYDLNNDAVPEMFLLIGNESSIPEIQAWSVQDGAVKKVGTLQVFLASGGFSLYINKDGKLVLYSTWDNDTASKQKTQQFSYSDGNLVITETVELIREWDYNNYKVVNGTLERGPYIMTCTVNGEKVSNSQAQSRYDSIGSDVVTVLIGDGYISGDKYDLSGISKGSALNYLDGIDAFFDVSADQYYASPVKWAIENGITNGTGQYSFSPASTCTRAQILTFLWRAAGSPEPTRSNPFSDVKPNAYYYKSATWAAEHGMVSGSIFDAATPCTRSATVTYIWQYAGSPASSKSTFGDVPESAAYSQAVAWAVNNGVTDGTGNNKFSPDNICSRGQIVTFLYRARDIKPASISEASWSSAYREFLFNKTFLKNGQVYQDEVSYIVSLYDMDSDGTPELKIDNGASGRSTRCAYLYTYSGGNISYLGIGPTDAFYDTDGSAGIYGYYQISGYEVHCTLYTKDGLTVKNADKGWYTSENWPNNLTRMYGASLENIRDMGWETFVSKAGY